MKHSETRTRRARGQKPYTRVAHELGISENTAILATTCGRTNVLINRFAEVIYETNRYSIPARFAYRDAIIEISDDRIFAFVDTILVAEHERVFGKHKAILNLVHFIDRLSFLHRDVVLAEVLRRRRFHHWLQSLLDGYVESDTATASKRFMRVVALLEHNTMQSVYDAIIASKQRDTDDPAMIALVLEHTERPNDPDDNPLRVFDSQESPTDECDLYQEKFASREDLLLNDLD